MKISLETSSYHLNNIYKSTTISTSQSLSSALSSQLSALNLSISQSPIINSSSLLPSSITLSSYHHSSTPSLTLSSSSHHHLTSSHHHLTSSYHHLTSSSSSQHLTSSSLWRHLLSTSTTTTTRGKFLSYQTTQERKTTAAIMTHNGSLTSEARDLPSSFHPTTTIIPITPHELRNESDFNPLTTTKNGSFSASVNEIKLNLANFDVTTLLKAFLYLAGLISGYILRHVAKRVVNRLYRNYLMLLKRIRQRNNRIGETNQQINLSTLPSQPPPSRSSAGACPPLPLEPHRLCCGTRMDTCCCNPHSGTLQSQNIYETLPTDRPIVNQPSITTQGYEQPIADQITPINHVSPNYSDFTASVSNVH